ncbi:type IV pilin protein [Acinetobacter terrestris]|uniref:Prepilin-type N-terminal cleavage/methylation domain-containing protein n=1 Tax=Acinetobacter terrestris TaxID=2529843 RepID=A0AAW6UVL8_9GAMM|nr:prepilin-type N-terminal cleavage/methylation domain-containing protein [Acinetobacter terrestris]MDK1684486.1 prepilin-type N-terminal cleavage/methylation domain-containing protein [Acinetobacter terrestris]
MKKMNKGFTLIELMVVVMIVGMIAVIALPSYQAYVRKSFESSAQQEIQKIIRDLEHQKSRQFNYLGYALASDPLYLPVGSSSLNAKYTLEVMDGDDTSKKLNATTSPPTGKNWVIRAKSSDNLMYSYLINSKGTNCKNKTANNVSFTSCGVGVEAWTL